MMTLFIMVGAPGSGKSTWAKNNLISRPYTMYVSRDQIRLSIITDEEHYFSHEDEVYDKFVSEIAAGIRANVDVIADATHLSRASRKKLITSLAAKGINLDMYNIIFVMMDTPAAVCIERDATRVGRQHVTASVVSRMSNQIQVPTTGEFKNVKEVWLIRG